VNLVDSDDGRCIHGKYPENRQQDGCWACFDKAFRRPQRDKPGRDRLGPSAERKTVLALVGRLPTWKRREKRCGHTSRSQHELSNGDSVAVARVLRFRRSCVSLGGVVHRVGYFGLVPATLCRLVSWHSSLSMPPLDASLAVTCLPCSRNEKATSIEVMRPAANATTDPRARLFPWKPAYVESRLVDRSPFDELTPAQIDTLRTGIQRMAQAQSTRTSAGACASCGDFFGKSEHHATYCSKEDCKKAYAAARQEQSRQNAFKRGACDDVLARLRDTASAFQLSAEYGWPVFDGLAATASHDVAWCIDYSDRLRFRRVKRARKELPGHFRDDIETFAPSSLRHAAFRRRSEAPRAFFSGGLSQRQVWLVTRIADSLIRCGSLNAWARASLAGEL
jgi:hypothetical protein